MAYSPTSPHWERTPGYGIPKWVFWRKPPLILGKQLAIKPSHVSFLWNYRNQPWQRKIRHRWFPQLTKSFCRGFSSFFTGAQPGPASARSIDGVWLPTPQAESAGFGRRACPCWSQEGQATLGLPNDFKHIWRFGFLHSPKGAEVRVSHTYIYIHVIHISTIYNILYIYQLYIYIYIYIYNISYIYHI